MPMVRDMVASLSKVPLIDDVNPDEAVAVGAAVQGILSLLKEEETTGEKTLSDDTRQQFSSRDGGLIQVTNITSHTLGVVATRSAARQGFPRLAQLRQELGERWVLTVALEDDGEVVELEQVR